MSLEHWYHLKNGPEIGTWFIPDRDKSESVNLLDCNVFSESQVFNQQHLQWYKLWPSFCLFFPVPIIQVFTLFLTIEAQSLLRSSKSWVLGQGRRCAWGILVFLEGNVALKQFAYKEGMSKIQSEERDLKYSGTTQVCPEKWGSMIYAWIYDHTESHVS